MIMSFLWEKKYSVGISVIDEQHKKLFKLINDLEENELGFDIVVYNKVLEALVAYTKYHFTTEEVFFNKVEYSGAKDHIDAHKRFVSVVEKASSIYNSEEQSSRQELIEFLKKWIMQHVDVVDREYTGII